MKYVICANCNCGDNSRLIQVIETSTLEEVYIAAWGVATAHPASFDIVEDFQLVINLKDEDLVNAIIQYLNDIDVSDELIFIEYILDIDNNEIIYKHPMCDVGVCERVDH